MLGHISSDPRVQEARNKKGQGCMLSRFEDYTSGTEMIWDLCNSRFGEHLSKNQENIRDTCYSRFGDRVSGLERINDQSKHFGKRSCIYKASLWNNEKGIFSLLEMFSKINGDIYMVLMKTGAKRGLEKTFKPFFSYPK
jgi:hypothetical protein